METISPLRAVSSSSFLDQSLPTRTNSNASSKKSCKKSKEPTDKPKRPLSAYNFFFQHERAQILKATPSRYDGTKPRRSHGKIGFGALARSVAAKWNNIDPEARKHFDDLASADKQRYKKEMEDWKASQTLVTKPSPVGTDIGNTASNVKMSKSLAPTMSAQSIIKRSIMAAHDTGITIFNSRYPGASKSNQQPFFQSFGAGMPLNIRANATSAVVGQALAVLDNGRMNNFHSLDEPTFHLVQSEESSLPSASCSSGRRESVPHISELAAKLDDDCLGFMTGLLF
jgi:HMG-box domain